MDADGVAIGAVRGAPTALFKDSGQDVIAAVSSTAFIAVCLSGIGLIGGGV